MAVLTMPPGRNHVIPQLTVRDAAAAIAFYKEAFGAEELRRADGPGGTIMHAEISIDGSQIYVNDAFGSPAVPPAGFNLHLWSHDVDAAVARAVKAGGTLKMPVATMFWGDRFGQVVDPFGVLWSIATHVEDVAPEEAARRGEAFFAKNPM